MIKFNEKFENFDYILSFDLAKRLSGYCLYDIKKENIVSMGMIDSEKIEEEKIYSYLYDEFVKIMKDCQRKNYNFFIVKEKLPTQNGIRSTIVTLQELAKVHAIFDLAINKTCSQYYDLGGVHSTSVKAYFKHLTSIEKPSKQDIADYIKSTFYQSNFDKMSHDVTDSIAVLLTLINVKWDNDINEQIKMLKKDMKKFKTEKKIKELETEIERLKSLKIHKEN